MALELDVPDDGATPFFDLTTQLDGADYRLRFRWGERSERWVLDVETSAGVPIVTGQVITIGKDLLARGDATIRPPGVLVALGKSSSVEPPAIGELGLGQRVGLVYFAANG